MNAFVRLKAAILLFFALAAWTTTATAVETACTTSSGSSALCVDHLKGPWRCAGYTLDESSSPECSPGYCAFDETVRTLLTNKESAHNSACTVSSEWAHPEVDNYYLGVVNSHTHGIYVHFAASPTCSHQALIGGSADCDREVKCPPGYGYDGNLCYRLPSDPQPPDPDKNKGCCSPPSGGAVNIHNPINIGAGNKFLFENDIPANSGGLQFQRAYNSLNPNAYSLFGTGWQHNYNLTLSVDAVSDGVFSYQATAVRGDGHVVRFIQTVGSSTWVSDPDVTDQLQTVKDGSGNVTGYQLIDGKSDRVESYDTSGKLASINDARASQSFTFAYDGNLRLQTVTDRSGRQLQIGYNSSGRISDVWQPESILGNPSSPHWQYGYDANNNLTTVTTPSGTTRTYVYENSSFVNALTGIVDETSNRYITYVYDTNGNASGENLWSGPNQTSPVGQYTLVDQGGYLKQVTEPLGLSTHFQFKVVQGVLLLGNASQPCALCGTVKSRSYDATTGFTTQTTDFNGNITTYSYNTRGLDEQHVDASGTSAQRTTNTTWNANFRVPTQRSVVNASSVTESLTKWAYNTRGQATARCVVDPAVSGATSYTCGSSTNAPTGVRQTTYTYCEQAGVTAGTCPIVGLVLSVDGPRTDVTDVTTYTYYQTTDVSGCATLGGTCHSKGDLLQVTNALGQITTFISYDKNGRVTRQSDANGTLTDMTYNARGWLLTRIVRDNASGSASANDATTTFAYDNIGNVTKVTQPDGAYLSYTYDTAHRLTDITDNLGNRIHYTLDAAGNRTNESTKDPGGTLKRSLSRQYSQLSRLTKVLNASSATVQQYTNPADAPPTGITYTDGYDGNGNAIYSVDGNGVGTEQQYDPLNRLVKTLQDHAGTGTTHDTTTQYAYDARDNLRSVTDPDNLTTNYTYDGLNNLTALSSPDTGGTSYTYDATGNRKTQTDARGIVTTYSYDALNRLASISYPTSSLNVSYAYDQPNSATGCASSYPIGRLTRMTDSSGSTVYCYDRRGNIVNKTQAVAVSGNPAPTNWALASNGGVASASSTYSSSFDPSSLIDGDRTGKNWGNNGGWNDGTASFWPDWAQITFNGAKTINVVKVYTLQDVVGAGVEPTDSMTFSQYGVTDFDVQVLIGSTWTTVASVTGNNLVKRTVTFSPVTTTAIRVQCNAVLPGHVYSHLVEIEATNDSSVITTANTYTVADRLASITYPSGAVVTYTRDAVGRINGVTFKANATAAAQTLVSNATYYPFGPLQTLTNGSGHTLTKTYDQDYAISSVQSSLAGATVIGLTVDSLGNLTTASNAIGASPPTQKYLYDPLYRLQRVNDGSNTLIDSFTYGLTGDRLSETTPSGTTTYTYSSPLTSHRLLSVGGVSRSYDANGNLRTNANGTLGYDDRNRLIGLNTGSQPAGLVTLSSNYNGKGERVASQSGTTGSALTTTLYYFNEGGQLLGANTYGSPLQEYIYMDGTLVGMTYGGALNYLETDHLGTARAIIVPGAAPNSDYIGWKWDFFGSAFGTNAPNPAGFNLRFPGQYFDTETGLHYNYLRDYEPATGRYVEPDPLFKPQTFGIPLFEVAPFAPRFGLDVNLYSYVSQLPLALTDVTGQGMLDYFKCLWYTKKMAEKNKECRSECNAYDNNGTDIEKTIEWSEKYTQYAGPLSGESASSAALGCACYKAGGPEFCKKWLQACLLGTGPTPKPKL